MDCRPPGSSVHGIFQARVLECVAISSSRGFSWPRDQSLLHWQADSLPLSHLGSPPGPWQMLDCFGSLFSLVQSVCVCVCVCGQERRSWLCIEYRTKSRVSCVVRTAHPFLTSLADTAAAFPTQPPRRSPEEPLCWQMCPLGFQTQLQMLACSCTHGTLYQYLFPA